MFYKKGKKTINKKLINYLTPLALAIWISDDGCWTQYGVRIASNAFTLKEVELLVNMLKINFNINCSIQEIHTKNKYSIYIKKEFISKLRSIILPHLHNSMLYKVGL